MEHFPVILVAQEWRRWAMDSLQHNLSPKPEIKAWLARSTKPRSRGHALVGSMARYGKIPRDMASIAEGFLPEDP